MTDSPKEIEPIPPEMLCKGASIVQKIEVEGDFTYWSELRPENGGRSTIVRLDKVGKKEDMTPLDFNVQTCVHEYGGGAFTVDGGRLFASNGEDGAVYLIESGLSPRRLTEARSEKGETRFADLHLTPQGLVAIGESHAPNQPVENFLALIDINTGGYTKLATGYDFYSSPALSADGKKIAWICWNHPHMPWTKSELWMADLNSEGKLENVEQVCGEGTESVFQPQWSPEGILYFVTDRDQGWWNLHRYNDGRIENILPIDAEVAEPLWIFGLSTYAFLGDEIVFTFNTAGKTHLGAVNRQTGKFREIARRGVHLHQVKSNGHSVRFLEQFTDQGEALFELELGGWRPKKLHQASLALPQEAISTPIHISYPSKDRIAFGFFYKPLHTKEGEKPPLLVTLHGGPTAQAKGSFRLEHQFWLSRGFAILDVNYGGSTGYGRAYRELLNGQWGVVDVEDCVYGARFLVEQGLVDGNRLAIRGKSAGGYTTLAALAFHDTFHAGASHYGIADITALMEDTHKFEKYYPIELVGKYPEEKELWDKRSPIHSVDQIKAPLILFQGENDRVVPKNQSEMIYSALKAKGLNPKLHIFPNEGHGFKQDQHIIECLTLEAEFYNNVFNQKR